jgi:pimeloyl-ACP methyl ester carboxylesterase
MTTSEPTLVFIHGAFHGSWVWRELFKQLSVPGWRLQTVDLPSVAAKGEPRRDLFDDADAVRRALESVDGPIVAVAHSYGGLPLTQAAAGVPNVHHLVYLCAFQLDVGESLLGDIGQPPNWWIVDDDTISPDRPVDTFYADVAPDLAAWAVSRLRPSTHSSKKQHLTAAAWRDIPSTYVICEHDRALPASGQEQMARRATNVHRLPCSHSPMLSRVPETAAIIADVAIQVNHALRQPIKGDPSALSGPSDASTQA